MSKINEKSCAASDKINRFEDIDFKMAEEFVKKLQRRIAKAQQAGETDKVKFLQHKLIHSFYEKVSDEKIKEFFKALYEGHKNICSNLMDIASVLDINDQDVFLSFLPLHHVFECTVGFLFSLKFLFSNCLEIILKILS